MLDRILNTSLNGVLIMIVAAFIVYGAEFIVTRVIRIPKEQSLKHVVITKLIGLAAGILGMLKILEII